MHGRDCTSFGQHFMDAESAWLFYAWAGRTGLHWSYSDRLGVILINAAFRK